VQTTPVRRPALVQAGAAVGAASMAANVLAFGLTYALGRIFPTAGFGAVTALLGVAIVGQVPAMALQAVVARRIALAPSASGLARSLLTRSAMVALAVGAVGAALAVPLASLLHLTSVWPVLWLAASLVPTTLIFAIQGLLQGAERFTGLAMLLLLFGAARVAGGIAGAFAGLSGVFAGICAGAVLGVTAGLVIARRQLAAGPDARVPLSADLWHAMAGLGALLALTNVDVILARHYLPAHQSGLYAAGTVASKIAFWFPQAVAMVAFPRLTDPRQRDALLAKAAAVITGLGLLTSGATALVGPWLLGHLLNPDFAALGPSLGLFAAAGAAGTLVQLVLYTGIASGDRAINAVLGAAVAVLVGVVALAVHGSVLSIVLTVLTVQSMLAAGGLAYARRRSARTRVS
jgi:O-antigen/teichoic acid export membrane protein